MGTLRILTRAASLPAATLLLLTFFLLLPQAARAQWTTSGSDISNTNTGNVGVGGGNTTPKYKIDLSAANTQLRFGSDTSDSGGYLISTVPSQALMAGGTVWNGSAWVAKTTSASFFEASLGSLKFYTNTGLAAGSTFSPSQRMIIDSSGNVGIGTATPHSMLEVMGGTLFGTVDGGNMTATDSSAMAQNVGGSILFAAKYDTAGNYAGFARILGVKENATSGNYGGALIFETRVNGGNQTEYMRITSTGKVGIGTATPTTAKLVISGTAGATGLDLSSTDQYAEMRVIRNSLGAADKDMYLQFQAGAGSKTHLYSNNSETMTLAGGSVGIGTATPGAGYKLDVNGNTNVTGAISTTGAINAGGAITGATVNATYQDVAEWVPSTQKLSAGTVVILDTDHANQVLASTKEYDTKVAGVVSAQPGISLGQGGDGKLLVATTGRVKVRVDATRAPIKVGDLLVTSDVEGVAMKSIPVDLGGTQIHRPGTIIGKALESLASGTGEILVLLSLQ